MQGLTTFKLSTSQPGNDTNPAIDCIDWYNENKHLKQEYRRISGLLPECPCDISLAKFDPWFWRIRFQLPWWQWWGFWGRWGLDYDPDDIVCVDIAPAEMLGQYGKVRPVLALFRITLMILILTETNYNVYKYVL